MLGIGERGRAVGAEWLGLSKEEKAECDAKAKEYYDTLPYEVS